MGNPDHDVIIAGAGPAGCTAATLLARQGHRVLMLERERHPRFHIGESMLPMSAPVFDRLGFAWDERSFLPKNGAEFVHEGNRQKIRFALNGDHQPYQVERALFDSMMADNAVAQGASLHQEEAVKSVAIDDDGVTVATTAGEYRARYFIDATGRSVLMGRANNSIRRIDNLGKFALYTHYRDATSDTARQLFACGDIKILLLDTGWLWVIPLVGNRLSVGLVVQQRTDKSHRGAELFNRCIETSPLLTELLQGAQQEAPVRAEADFSFTNTRRYGARFACCGDAAGFLDPIFSSGVFLAVTGAERVADRLRRALESGTEGDAGLHAVDDTHYTSGFRSMQLFVERFYQYDMVQRLFFQADQNESIKNDIAALLSGDLWREDNDFQRMLLEGRQNDRLMA